MELLSRLLSGFLEVPPRQSTPGIQAAQRATIPETITDAYCATK